MMPSSPFFRRHGVVLIGLLIGLLALGYAYRHVLVWMFFQFRQAGPTVAQSGQSRSELPANDVEVVTTGLRVPWALAFLPDGTFLVTERPGRLKRVSLDGAVVEVTGLDATEALGEGGLLGIAVHPRFAENHWIYLYQTIQTPDGPRNRVIRYRLEHDALSARTTVVQNIPAGGRHNGGALVFGPDDRLYIATGDSGDGTLAQDLGSLAGKVLRMNDDGSVPSDNPYGTPVWSYGHRNIQGLAWDGQGRLWATEHGRSGTQTGFDELNLIEPGINYGWPTIEGDGMAEGMRTAFVHSGPTEPWAPSGLAAFGQSLFFGGLRGESLYQARLGVSPMAVLAHLEGDFGRLRGVTIGPDRRLYLTTSNTDGRGLPTDDDDRIIRVNTAVFE